MDKKIALGKIVLASQSPRRLQLLQMIGIEPEVRVANVVEVPEAGESARDYVQRLARAKALAVTAAGDELVVAADTVVVLRDGAQERILEKPAGVEEAQAMLQSLSGREHFVLTGFALRQGADVEVGLEESAVHFWPLEESEIAAYVATGEPFDKAGGYAIQGYAAMFVSGITGCYYNVMGLPVSHIYQALKPRFKLLSH
jgi:septum formation protein